MPPETGAEVQAQAEEGAAGHGLGGRPLGVPQAERLELKAQEKQGKRRSSKHVYPLVMNILALGTHFKIQSISQKSTRPYYSQMLLRSRFKARY